MPPQSAVSSRKGSTGRPPVAEIRGHLGGSAGAERGFAHHSRWVQFPYPPPCHRRDRGSARSLGKREGPVRHRSVAPRPRSETDITSDYESEIPSSNLGEDTNCSCSEADITRASEARVSGSIPDGNTLSYVNGQTGRLLSGKSGFNSRREHCGNRVTAARWAHNPMPKG